MTLRSELARIVQQEDINFLLTNRIPRRLVTRFLGWFSQIENPVVARASIGVWRLFADLDLSDARLQSFKSLHACFTRELKPGARPVDGDPRVLTSPCDAIVGACGAVDGTRVLQAKGFPYALQDLLVDPALIEAYRCGQYATLRLTSSMYHRFHAPGDGTIERVTYISGDTWNVNPIALRRVASLFCKNERAVIRTRLSGTGHLVTLVPVAAILVASIRLHFLDVVMNMNYRGAAEVDCDVPFRKGDELGWFEHGSTIIVFAPPGFRLCHDIREGTPIRMGRALMHLP
ncbi:MAG TPA: archaetidylserine decarboxylase [Reyranella sp.]|nr:archaetidylserine decarboxylase [Reyranella sp.]